MSSLLIENLSKSFDVSAGLLLRVVGKVAALKNVSVSLAENESLGVVGESGCGKTTLAKILAGFLEADSGSAHFMNHDLRTLSRHDRAGLVQMVFQDPFASLNPKLLLGTQLFEALQMKSKGSSKDDARQLMNDVGLSIDFLARYPHQLSGGQRQRFAIARALAAQPKLLIADEPVSALDLSVQAQIINLLNALRKEKGFTLIVISHDLAVIANLCTHVIVMKEGVVMESGPVSNVLSHPKDAYTRRLIDAVALV